MKTDAALSVPKSLTSGRRMEIGKFRPPSIPASHNREKAYTEGLRNVRLGDGSPELNAVEAALLSNRAMANLALKNYGSCRKDCDEALALSPGNVKCLYRKAKAELLLRRYR